MQSNTDRNMLFSRREQLQKPAPVCVICPSLQGKESSLKRRKLSRAPNPRGGKTQREQMQSHLWALSHVQPSRLALPQGSHKSSPVWFWHEVPPACLSLGWCQQTCSCLWQPKDGPTRLLGHFFCDLSLLQTVFAALVLEVLLQTPLLEVFLICFCKAFCWGSAFPCCMET